MGGFKYRCEGAQYALRSSETTRSLDEYIARFGSDASDAYKLFCSEHSVPAGHLHSIYERRQYFIYDWFILNQSDFTNTVS